ncbi:hypothetical protein, partial [Arthrospira sp. PCC 8006]
MLISPNPIQYSVNLGDRVACPWRDRIPDYTGKMAAGRQYERSRSTSRRRSGLPESSVRLSVI